MTDKHYITVFIEQMQWQGLFLSDNNFFYQLELI